jgi:hypothetical protein
MIVFDIFLPLVCVKLLESVYLTRNRTKHITNLGRPTLCLGFRTLHLGFHLDLGFRV